MDGRGEVRAVLGAGQGLSRVLQGVTAGMAWPLCHLVARIPRHRRVQVRRPDRDALAWHLDEVFLSA